MFPLEVFFCGPKAASRAPNDPTKAQHSPKMAQQRPMLGAFGACWGYFGPCSTIWEAFGGPKLKGSLLLKIDRIKEPPGTECVRKSCHNSFCLAAARKVHLHQLFKSNQLTGVGGPGAPHAFEFTRAHEFSPGRCRERRAECWVKHFLCSI